MPGLLEAKSSLTPTNLDHSLSLEEDMSLDGRSQASPASLRVSSSQFDGVDIGRSNETAESDSPDSVTDLGNGGRVPQSPSQVIQDSTFISSDGDCISNEQTDAIEGPTENGGSEVVLQEQVFDTNGRIEDMVSCSPTQSSKPAAQHSKEGIATQAFSHPAKLNPKKKPALSPRFLMKSKESEKEKLPSPRPPGNKPKEAGKDRGSAKVPSPAASALKGKDVDKEKVASILLPPATSKEVEKEKISSPRTPQELEKGRSKIQDAPKVKDRTKPLSVTAPGKRVSSLTVKPPDNSSPTENAKHIAMLKDKERASPNTPISPNRSNVKGTFTSPLRPLRITPPSSSEKPPLSTSKFSPKKPALRQMGPESPASAIKVAEKKMPLDKVPLDQDKALSDETNQKVKVLFQRRMSVVGSRKFGDNESVASSEQANHLTRENPNLGPFLLKLARQAIVSGDNPQKALDYASRAAKSYESAADGKPSLDLVMSLHILAATHCTMGQFEEAIPVLQHSIEVTDIEGEEQDHALAAFAGNMQLGDTYSMLGKGEDALSAYHVGLEVQKRALGEMDPRVGETCRYLAEAHTQAMQFDRAEDLCQHALNIHKEHSAPASIEEATDRRLMGLICNGKGEHEAALEHLVLASMALIANGKDVDVAAVDTSIGDTYASLGRFDEAVFSYQKALTVFKASKGENHVAVAAVYVSLAELYLKTGKFRECKTYCDSAFRIFNKQGAGTLDEIASGLTELAVVYEALNEQEQALSLLKKALGLLDAAPGQQSSAAGIEAQIGVLSYMCGNYVEARSSLSRAVSKLRGSAEKTSALFGIVLNQMGLCCLHLSEIKMAAQLFEESRSVLESACGPHHPDTLTVCSNLAGAYDALGRLDDAIGALQHVVEVREEELGTANSEVEDERSRLAELLREAGRFRARRLNNTLGLLMHPKSKQSILAMPGHNVFVSVNG